jgi:hypothetical protein
MALKYLYVPSGTKAGTAYGVLPNSANADFDDFTRSSAGSRVDKNGFINTGLGLGSEEVTNGGFSSDSNWTKGTGWTIANGVATYDGTGGTSFISQNLSISINTLYEVKITVISNEGTGTNTIEIGNHRINSDHLDAGTYTFYGTSTSGTFIVIYGRSGEEFVIDNVSVREVTEVNTDVPRIDYTGGGCPSLLLEHTSTNKIGYSEDFTQSSWTKEGNPTIESNVEISPTGSLNGSYLKAPVGTNISPRIVYYFGCASGQTYTGSIFVKKDNVDYIRLLSTGATASTLNAYYNVSNGTLGTSGSPDKAKIEDYGNGWYRLSLVINTTQNTGSATFRVQLAKGDGAPTSTYDGTEKNIIFGAQLEQKSYATSYIPNYGTAAGVTRSADNGNSTGDISSAINEEEGVFFAYMAAHTSEALDTPQWLTLSEGSSNNSFIALRYSNAADSIQVRYRANGGTAVQINTTTIDRSNFNKIAFRWKANDFSLWINGSLIETNTTLDIITANNLNRLKLANMSGGQNLYSKVREIRIYDKYESDSEMEKLTTL